MGINQGYFVDLFLWSKCDCYQETVKSFIDILSLSESYFMEDIYGRVTNLRYSELVQSIKCKIFRT